MLLDQKRTKRIVQVVAILTALAFAGVIFVVLGLIVFGGGGTSATEERVDAAQGVVQQQPRDPDAWEDLAAALLADGKPEEAIEAQERAVELDPDDLSRLQTLVGIQTQAGNHDAAVAALERYTRDNPRDAEAFLLLAQSAERAGRRQLAALSYQRFLALAPDNPLAEDVRERLQALRGGQ